MAKTFHPAPGWPQPSAGWQPPAGWQPNPEWPAAPLGWVFWTDTSLHEEGTAAATDMRRSVVLRFGWLITLIVGVVAYLVVLYVMVGTSNILMFPSLLLIGSVTVPMSVLLLAYGTEEYATGHGGLVTLTVIAGAVIGTTTAAFVEYSTLKTLPWLGMIAVGLIEEAAKLIVPLVIFLTMRKHSPGLGLVLGVASGAGFAALETMGYGLAELIVSQGNLAAVDTTLLMRGILSPAGHVAWSGLTCAALWRMGEIPPPTNRWPVFLGAYLLAAGLHAAWDGTTALIPHLLVAVISVAVLLTLVATQSRRTHRAGVLAAPARQD